MDKIPEEDSKIFRKYSKGQALRFYQKEESLQQTNKDLFSLMLVLILCVIFISIFILDKYYYSSIVYINNILMFIPLILVLSLMILGNYYKKTSKYQIVLSSLIILMVLVLEYIYIYFYFNYRFIPPLPINLSVFIFISSIGVFAGLCFGFFFKIFINETDEGNSENFEIEVLSHTDTNDLKSFEKLLKIYINYIIHLKQTPSYDNGNEKIFQKVGFDDTFLLYVISKNVFAYLLFSKKGRYIYQDEKSIEIQKKISFLLKNSLNFKDVNEEARNKAKESCINLLSEYEINVLTVYIGTHKKETAASIFIITIFVFFYLSYPFDIILNGVKNIVNTIVMPQIITILVTTIVIWFISSKNK